MADDVFSRIIAGELPSVRIWEDEDVLAILDIEPVNIGHVLVLAKCPCIDIRQVPDKVLIKILPLARDIGVILCETLGYNGFNIHQSNGSAAGQDVMHFHLHIWPRREKDEVRLMFKSHPSYGDGEMAQVGAELSRALSRMARSPHAGTSSD